MSLLLNFLFFHLLPFHCLICPWLTLFIMYDGLSYRSPKRAIGECLSGCDGGLLTGSPLQLSGQSCPYDYLAEGWRSGGNHKSWRAVHTRAYRHRPRGWWNIPLPGWEWTWPGQQLSKRHRGMWVNWKLIKFLSLNVDKLWIRLKHK